MNEKKCPSSNRHFSWFIPFRTDMSVRGDTSRVIYTPCFPIFINNKKNLLLTSLHIIHFCAIVLQVEFVGVLRSVPLRRNEIRSILGDFCPLSSVQVEGQIRLKDTTLSLGSDLLSNHCLYYRFVFFKYFLFLVLNEHGNYNI